MARDGGDDAEPDWELPGGGEGRRDAGHRAGEEAVLREPELAVAETLGELRHGDDVLGRHVAAEHEADRGAGAGHVSPFHGSGIGDCGGPRGADVGAGSHPARHRPTAITRLP